jgi:hypothetical protein
MWVESEIDPGIMKKMISVTVMNSSKKIPDCLGAGLSRMSVIIMIILVF